MSTAENANGLLPCPFCGSESASIVEDEMNGYNITCNGPISCVCYILKEQCVSRTEAARRWNRRDGSKCRNECKFKRAIKTMIDSLGGPEASECDE